MSASTLGEVDEMGKSKEDLINALNDSDCSVALEAACSIIKIDVSLAEYIIEILNNRNDAPKFQGLLEKIIHPNDDFLIEQLGNADKAASNAAEFVLLERVRRKSSGTIEKLLNTLNTNSNAEVRRKQL